MMSDDWVKYCAASHATQIRFFPQQSVHKQSTPYLHQVSESTREHEKCDLVLNQFRLFQKLEHRWTQ